MSRLLHGPVFAITLTLAGYVAGAALHRQTRSWLLHPVIVSVFVIGLVLRLVGVDAASYERGAQPITLLLAPSVVSLGLTLHEQRSLLEGRIARLLGATALGSVVGVASVVLIARMLGGSRALCASLAPKSVTTPIAMAITERLGGDPKLTGAVVIAIGTLGAVAAPPLLRALGVTGAVPFGVAMGAAAHGIGTARAVQEGQTQGAASALAIGLCGLFTALFAPIVLWSIERLWPWSP